jgi:hypothetical protein
MIKVISTDVASLLAACPEHNIEGAVGTSSN